MNAKIFTSIWLGISDPYDRSRRRGRVPPIYFSEFDSLESESETIKKLNREFLRILSEAPLTEIGDFGSYTLEVESLAKSAGISPDVRGIKDRLREASRLSWEQDIRDGKDGKRVEDLIKRADIYSTLADPHIWQRQRFMTAMHNLLRDVIENGVAVYRTGENEGEEVEFNQANLDFKRVEEIAYWLIETGHVKEGIYALEAMRERITNPLIRGIVLYYYDSDQATKILEEAKGQIAQWF